MWFYLRAKKVWILFDRYWIQSISWKMKFLIDINVTRYFHRWNIQQSVPLFFLTHVLALILLDTQKLSRVFSAWSSLLVLHRGNSCSIKTIWYSSTPMRWLGDSAGIADRRQTLFLSLTYPPQPALIRTDAEEPLVSSLRVINSPWNATLIRNGPCVVCARHTTVFRYGIYYNGRAFLPLFSVFSSLVLVRSLGHGFDPNLRIRAIHAHDCTSPRASRRTPRAHALIVLCPCKLLVTLPRHEIIGRELSHLIPFPTGLINPRVNSHLYTMCDILVEIFV